MLNVLRGQGSARDAVLPIGKLILENIIAAEPISLDRGRNVAPIGRVAQANVEVDFAKSLSGHV